MGDGARERALAALRVVVAPLLKLAGELDNVAEQIDCGVLQYEPVETVEYVRYALLLASRHLIEVLEDT